MIVNKQSRIPFNNHVTIIIRILKFCIILYFNVTGDIFLKSHVSDKKERLICTDAT